ncbi:hypothetical protein I6F37_39715 [Bradyrhizobium sp. NBAIM08]|nr:hypothetical protein [Bradyrhizobium sp. NBAIM08]
MALNRAVAVAELDGPAIGLDEVDRLAEPLADFHLFHSARGDMLRRLGRVDDAATAYDRALELAGNATEREFLIGRRESLAELREYPPLR